MGKLETQQVSLQLNEIVENTINQLTPITDEKNIAILFNPEHRIMVKADKVMLETVVRNLLRNAVKFSSQNDVITVNTFIKKDKAVVEVIDNGVGIPDSVQNVVLSGMYNSYGTNNEKGSGIGLIFCKELAEKNGGKLWFDSTEGKGSTFSFSVSLD
jgi:two-component system sensor histidine kinase/response regulator